MSEFVSEFDLARELWLRRTLRGYKTAQGAPPLNFNAKAGALINYRIYGNIEEVEVKTDMPLDLTQTTTVGAPAGMFTVSDDTVIVNGTPSSRYYALCQIPIFLDIAKYHISGCPAGGSSGTYRVDVRNSEGQQITLSIDTGSGFDISVNNAGTYYYTIRIQTGYSVDNKIFTPKIEKIETVIASVGDFVSSGEHAGEYLIPVTINSSTTDIYLSEPLAKSDYIDYKTQKRFNADGTSEDVTLPGITVPAGTDTLSVGTTVQPSVVKINYKKG